jgi:hypothetical protein
MAMVLEAGAAAVDAVVEIVSVVLPLPVTVAGLKLQFVSAGNPLQAKFTVPLNPPVAPILMVNVAGVPAFTVALPLLAGRVKSAIVINTAAEVLVL